jgi:hypothetical protein
MLSSGPLTIALCIGVALFFIYRQFTPQPLNARALVALPVALGYFGLSGLAKTPPDTFAAAGYLTLNVLVATLLGAWRGHTFRVWQDRGVVMRGATLATLGAWVALVAVRVVAAAGGHFAGLDSLNLSELPLSLALTFGAQNTVIWLKAVSPNGVPMIGTR